MNIGIDLGTANTVIYAEGKGIVLREPSVVALDRNKNEVIAVGIDAKNMTGRTPEHTEVIRPLQNGVITDTDITASMLGGFLKKAVKTGLFTRNKIVLCIPSCSTEVERLAAEDVLGMLYAKKAAIAEEPLAAAIGAGLDIESPNGKMILDIGGGTSETAVISSGHIIVSDSVKTGGDAFDHAIEEYIKKKYALIIGTNTAEEIKIKAANAFVTDKKETVLTIRGRNLKGLSSEVKVTSTDIRQALAAPLHIIAESVRKVLGDTPPELSADILDSGIVMTGGGALIRGIDSFIANETKLPVKIAESPLDCVAVGAVSLCERS